MKERGTRYVQAGFAVAGRLLDDEYLSADLNHEGILRHSVYHRPNGWDSVPSGQAVPSGESSMWGDYHLLELGLSILRISQEGGYTFYQSGESA